MDSSLLGYGSQMIDLRPLNELPDHLGQPRTKDVEFFAEPPTEIGKVSSAESTLLPGRKGMPLLLRHLIGVIIGGAIVYGGYWLGKGAISSVERETLQIMGGVLGLGALGITLLVTRFKAACSFVGENGIAIFTLRGSRTNMPKVKLLLFAQAEELRAKQIRHYYNGIYTGTTYDYSWAGPKGQRLWRSTGTYRERKKGLRAGDPFRLVQAAEHAWSESFLDRANQTLKTEGSIPFRVDKNRVVRVGPGFLEFHFGDKPMRFLGEDIASVSLGGGTFQFKHKDAKWYSLSGKYSFQYGNMANARVFLLALESLMGYQWT